MKKAIVTGAAGFLGCNLVETLLDTGYFVYAIARPNSAHNERFKKSERLKIILLDMTDYEKISSEIKSECDIFYHLTWEGRFSDVALQGNNIRSALTALEAAAKLGCKRFICAGSQAEYGVCSGLITEETYPRPITSYGTAKLATSVLTKQRARELGVEWIWARVFSLYGKYEPNGRMLPDLIKALKEGREFNLSAATQNWDYLYSTDGAEALIALGESGKTGEIYNVANGNYRPLREFTEEIRKIVAPKGEIIYGAPPANATSLKVSVDKIRKDTGWKPKVDFCDGVYKIIDNFDNATT